MDEINKNQWIEHNKIKHFIENDIKTIRNMKKRDLIIINKYYGYIFNRKKCSRMILIENLLPIHRKENLKKNILLGKEDCPICFTTLNSLNFSITVCGHAFCRECIFIYITKEQEICPLCRAEYTYDDFIKPLHPNDVEILLNSISSNIYDELNENINEHYSIYERIHIIYRTIIILVKVWLLYKSIEVLYILLIYDDKYHYAINDFYIINRFTTFNTNIIEQCELDFHISETI